MNQDQRKFLIERVNKTFKEQKEKLTDKEREKPSLNNYLVAAFLDNSIRFNDIDKLKENMRQTVLKYGVSDRLVKDDSDRWGNRRGNDDDKHYCEIVTEDLFILPESYKIALSEYEEYKKDIEGKIEDLEAKRDTILLKIQIGSNQALDKLITQVDNLADLNIMNSQFLLT